MHLTYVCEVCGEKVTRIRTPKNLKTTPRFCSQKCNGASRKGNGVGIKPNVSYNCATCGKEVITYRSPKTKRDYTSKYCSVACTGKGQLAKGNPSYSGGRHKLSNGYIVILNPNHPNADVRGYVLEHRLVMERAIGRYLTGTEVVHHRNHIRDDNRIETLNYLHRIAIT